MDITGRLKAMGVSAVYNYVDKDPEKNVPKLLDWLEKNDKNKTLTNQVRTVRDAIQDKDNNWAQLVNSLFTDIDAHQRKMLVRGALINGSLIGSSIQRETSEKHNCNVPWAILMDPTSACNLKCTGCWAAEYGNHMNLTFEEMDDIIKQGKKMGTYIYLFSGGEPLVRKKDIIRLCEKHDDCAFLAFTNATLIDDEFADEMLRVGNFTPAISIEGFEEATDARRGAGTYQQCIAAMKRLKERKLLFGISCCYTSQNTEVIGSEEYIDAMVDMGAKFAWFFTYMPIGASAVPELLVSAEQREYMYNQIRKFRSTKPIFTMDFWNDGEYVHGCIAGAKAYLHINANGDIEPCAFIHYSDSNIREKTLLEAYQSPLFMQYREHQPFASNMLRPCPVLDNPGMLTKLVDASGAKSTDMESPEAACDYCNRCVDVAREWKVTADRLWAESHHKAGEGKLSHVGEKAYQGEHA